GGVAIFGPSTGNVVQGNLIGTDITGTNIVDPHGTRLGNVFGVGISGNNNTVGGSTPGAGNVISGSFDPSFTFGHGVQLLSGASGNLVQGNKIGTDVTGTVALGNANDGVYIDSPNNTIGPGNLISGNLGDGVRINGSSANNNSVVGNLIGT